MAGPPAVRHPERGLAQLKGDLSTKCDWGESGWMAGTLGFWADLASLVSLGISILNAFWIFSIRRRILSNLALNGLLDRFRKNSRRMNGYLLRYDASVDGFSEVIGLCEADTRAVKRRLSFPRSRIGNRLLRSIANYRGRKSVDTAQGVYGDLQQLIQELTNHIEEIRIMGP
jgi:hypothetical protein